MQKYHRFLAAKKAGLASVPCRVRTLSDEEAYMQLILSNAQGELSPLEIGIHALGAVALGEKGRGNKGRLSEYARALGRSQQYTGTPSCRRI